MRRAHVRRDDIILVDLGRVVRLVDAKSTGKVRIKLAGRHGRTFAGITLLRCFAEAARYRGAGAMRVGEIGPAIK
jgi:hypothetical protein